MDAVWIRVIAAAVIAYFCGCFNGAVIVSKLSCGTTCAPTAAATQA